MFSGSIQQFLPDKEERFQHPGYSDVWATALFVLFSLGFAVLAGFAISTLSLTSTENYNPVQVAVLFAIDVAVGLLVSLAYLVLVYKYLAA